MTTTRTDGERHTMAAANHERAAQHYRQASRHYEEKDYAHAAHQSQVARWYAYRAWQPSGGLSGRAMTELNRNAIPPMIQPAAPETIRATSES